MRNRAPSRIRRSVAAERCRLRFLRFFPDGFEDETYLAWERNYKWSAHEAWIRDLPKATHGRLLLQGEFALIARRAVAIESRTNLLFSFEKMALRDAVRTPAGARLFSEGLYEFLHGRGAVRSRFERWSEVVGTLPRKQTRVLTWPLLTVSLPNLKSTFSSSQW